MREHTFRGRRLIASPWPGEEPWVKGSLIDAGDHSEVAIFPPLKSSSSIAVKDLVRIFAVPVDPDTVGEGTGITDRQGEEIFEGDFVTIQNTKKQGLPGVVRYSKLSAGFEIQRTGFNPIPLHGDYRGYIICGNIYSNSEGRHTDED